MHHSQPSLAWFLYRVSHLLATAILLSQVLGCGGKAPAVSPEQDGSMRALAMVYGQCTAQNRGRPPKNEQQLRKFLEDNAYILDNFGVASADDVFTSPRDNEPYEIVYGKRAKIVAYEKTGVDGKRMVADDLGIVKEVDEAEFSTLVPDAK